MLNGELNESFTTEVAGTEELLETNNIILLDIFFEEHQSIIFVVIAMCVYAWRSHEYIVCEQFHARNLLNVMGDRWIDWLH
jgi:hypothetical protein